MTQKQSTKLKIRVISCFIMLFAFTVNSFAGNQMAKGITLKLENVTLARVMSEIKRQSNYLFVNKGVDVSGTVTINVTNENISKVCNTLFTPLKISYTIEGDNIIIAKNPETGKRQVTISGLITDGTGKPVPGVAVLEKGTSNGTLSGLDGKYSMTVSGAGVEIEINCLGYKNVNFKVESKETIYNITLKDASLSLEGTVVTALGIRREEKSLSYNVQKLGEDILSTARNANFVASLQGKVAGLQISQSASGPGGSTRVVMRGLKSITRSNNALYVIDGIPMPEMRSSQTEGYFETPDGGDFEGITNINPEDIESMSILSGASAAALYGAQGANGVILINTKQGSKDKLSISYTNSTTFSSPFVTPKFQNIYGTDSTNPSMSWGEKLDSPSTYNPLDFFQTGLNSSNALSLSTGTQRSQTYVSAAVLNARGIIPNNAYRRYNFMIRNTTELLADKLVLDMSASYMRQYKRNPTIQGLYHNPIVPLWLFPRGDSMEKYRIFERYDANAGYMKQFWPFEFIDGVENPYWVTNRELFENLSNRYILSGTLKWNITNWMKLASRIRMDNTSMNYTRKIYASSNKLFASEYGNYQDNTINHNNLYGDILLSIDKKFLNDDLLVQFNAGASFMDEAHKACGFEGHLATVPNKFSVYNISMTHSQTKPYAERYHEQNQALYGTLQLGYKGMIYFDGSVRNDWSSQLAFTPNMSVCYYSGGLSAVISSMLPTSAIGVSFLKLRTSYSTAGNPPARYITGVNTPLLVGGNISSDTFAPAVNLKPELTKSFEVGLNAKFLEDMFWLDFTYYNASTYNQLFCYNAAPSTGYKQAYINAGNVNNYGIELSVGFQNKWNDFSLASSLTYSMNRNKIKELVPEGTLDVTGKPVTVDEVNMDYGGYRMKIRKGGSIGDFYVTGLKTDDYGRIYVDPNTNTVNLDPNTWLYAGNTEARARLGWQNTLTYKGLSLSFLFDARLGGRGVSATQALLDRWGASQTSADARLDGGVWISSDQKLPDVKAFYANNGNGTSMLAHYVYDMTNVRLRELSLGYDFPRHWFRDKLGMSLSLVGYNLLMIYNKAPFDPELTASTGTYYQGLDYFMQPSTRSMGFRVKLQF